MTTWQHKQLIESRASTDRYLIIGFGVTGQALARFFDQKKFLYFLADQNLVSNWTGEAFLGQIDTEQNFENLSDKNIKAIFPSPGVALTHPIIQWAHKKSIPIIGELELASFYLKGEFIAVTGTNGKSTAVKLINALLRDAGIKNELKGNIGSTLISAVSEPPKSFYVIEESSYQLELIGSMRHKIAVCLNVTEDHFDRYKGLEDYAHAKAQIFKNSTADDYFIFNYDDPWCVKMSQKSPAKNLPFSLVQKFREGAFVDGDDLVIRLKDKKHRFDLRQCALKGLHNTENMLASLLAVILVKDDDAAAQSYKKTLASFVGLPHRLQAIHSLRDVIYYDDSKATNINSVVMALASFDGNVILIAGGKDKHCDYQPLKGIVKNKVKNMILLGEAKDNMYDVLKDSTQIDRVESMRDAVGLANKYAKPGDVVLLSPACSSFDQYKNYEERGLDFQRWVKELR